MTKITYKTVPIQTGAMPACQIPDGTFFYACVALGQSLFYKQKSGKIFWILPGNRKDLALDICQTYQEFENYHPVDVELVIG